VKSFPREVRSSLLVSLLVCGCGALGVVHVPGDGGDLDAGLDDAGAADAGFTDAGGHDAGGADAGGADAGGFDAGAGHDAGVDAGTADSGVPCAEAGWTCSADGTQRSRCVGGQAQEEVCARGCLKPPPGTEASCLTSTSTQSCTASWGTTKSTSGDYFVTAFGCWVDSGGVVHTDSGDNCIPTCLSQARSSGLCQASDTGPQCEERVTWYTADAARFGCLARLRITNPVNGKSVIAVALDYGPSCTVENGVSFPVLDASGRVDRLLFGSDQGSTDRSLVHVVEVDSSTPLGPVP
jgi:hypothetical protein